MKRLAYLLLCMSLSTSVSAEWLKVLDAEAESFFIDPTSRVVVGEITTAVVLVNYKELNTIDGFPAKSSRIAFKFNCAKKQVMVASVTAYTGLQETGIQRVVLAESKAKEEWTEIGRQPTGELLNAACVR
jgi:hypothetical protein